MLAALPATSSEPSDEEGEGTPTQAAYQTPGDRLRPRWNPAYSEEATLARLSDGAEQQRGKLKHDDKGEAQLKLPTLSPGAYRLRYDTLDEFGQKVEAWKDFVVADSQASGGVPSALPFSPASRARRSGWSDGAAVCRLGLCRTGDEPGDLPQRSAYRTGALSGSTLIEYPIREEDRGGLGFVVWMVRDHQYLNQQLSLQVPWDNKELQISFQSFRDKLRPAHASLSASKSRAQTGPSWGAAWPSFWPICTTAASICSRRIIHQARCRCFPIAATACGRVLRWASRQRSGSVTSTACRGSQGHGSAQRR